jgi:hypothetical protein
MFPLVLELYRRSFQRVVNAPPGEDIVDDVETSLLAFKTLTKLTVYGWTQPEDAELPRVSLLDFSFFGIYFIYAIAGLLPVFRFRCFNSYASSAPLSTIHVSATFSAEITAQALSVLRQAFREISKGQIQVLWCDGGHGQPFPSLLECGRSRE